jgi:hypothetical protein
MNKMAVHNNIKEKIITSKWTNLLESTDSNVQTVFQGYTGSYLYKYGLSKSGPCLILLDAPFEFTPEEGTTFSLPEPGLYVLCNPNEGEYHNFTFEEPKIQIDSNYK